MIAKAFPRFSHRKAHQVLRRKGVPEDLKFLLTWCSKIASGKPWPGRSVGGYLHSGSRLEAPLKDAQCPSSYSRPPSPQSLLRSKRRFVRINPSAISLGDHDMLRAPHDIDGHVRQCREVYNHPNWASDRLPIPSALARTSPLRSVQRRLKVIVRLKRLGALAVRMDIKGALWREVVLPVLAYDPWTLVPTVPSNQSAKAWRTLITNSIFSALGPWLGVLSPSLPAAC
eukprot:381340-Amphidinium_carterae.1